MKKWHIYLIIIVLAISTSVITSSCSKKVGCPATESLRAPVNRKGELSSKHGNTRLFPKDMDKGKKKKNKKTE